MGKIGKLTAAQAKFCSLLTSDPEQNATKAYMGAYLQCTKASVAKAAASRLLTNVNVRNRIEKFQAKTLDKYELTAERVNKERACLAYFNPKDLFDSDGNMIPIHEWPDEVAAAIESIQVEQRREGHGEEAEIYTVHKITWAKKAPIFDQISKVIGQYEKDNAQKSGGMSDLIRAVDGNTRGLPDPEDTDDD